MVVEFWNIEEITGYKPITKFYTDFSIVDNIGVKEIKDLYQKTFDSCKNDYKQLTELVMVLNWRSWRWANSNITFSKLYEELYYKTHDYALNNLKGTQLSYYINTTD